MNEVQRLQYLEAIGIDSYMPRWILPLAPTPVACVPVISEPAANAAIAVLPSIAASAAEAVMATENSDAQALGRIAPPVAAIASVMASVSPTTVLPTTVLPATAPPVSAAAALAALAEPASAPAKAAAAVSGLVATVAKEADAAAVIDPQFSLSMWRATDDLLVIDSRQAHLALPTEPLLTNILLALGLPRSSLPRAEVLRWPMYDHPLSPKGEAAAKETLLAMLEARLEQQPVSYVLLMGAEACHYLVPGELLPGDQPEPIASYQALVGKALRLETVNATAIVVPSLSDMLQQPNLKATTWRAIQPLRRI